MLFFRSTQMVFQDADHALMTVSLFHKAVDDFKNKVRKQETFFLQLMGLGLSANSKAPNLHFTRAQNKVMCYYCQP